MKLKCGDSISSRSFLILISASAMHLRDATEWSEQASEDWWPFAILPCSLTPSRSPADSGRVHACFRHCGGLHHRTQVPPPPPSSVLPSSPARLREKKGRVATKRRTDADGRTDRGRIAARMRSAMPEGLHLFRFFPGGSKVEGDVARQTEGARAANSQLYPWAAGSPVGGRGRHREIDQPRRNCCPSGFHLHPLELGGPAIS